MPIARSAFAIDLRAERDGRQTLDGLLRRYRAVGATVTASGVVGDDLFVDGMGPPVQQLTALAAPGALRLHAVDEPAMGALASDLDARLARLPAAVRADVGQVVVDRSGPIRLRSHPDQPAHIGALIGALGPPPRSRRLLGGRLDGRAEVVVVHVAGDGSMSVIPDTARITTDANGQRIRVRLAGGAADRLRSAGADRRWAISLDGTLLGFASARRNLDGDQLHFGVLSAPGWPAWFIAAMLRSGRLPRMRPGTGRARPARRP